MNRREFNLFAAAATMGAPLLLSQQAMAQQDIKNLYKTLDPQVPVDTPAGKVLVIEFFSYGCSHCKDFEPIFEEWISKAPKYMVIERVPIDWGEQFKPLQRIYYTLVEMKQMQRLQSKVFDAVQVEGRRLDKPEVMKTWASENGLDGQMFMKIFNSFGINNQLNRATLLQDQYKIEGTPGMGVGGQYSTDSGMAKGFNSMLTVVQTLAQDILKGHK